MRYPTDTSYIDIITKYPTANIYWVGGCVRDIILGVEPKDIDYVITGLTPSDMNDLGFNGHGEAFFVYIHPTTGVEMALARSEQKVGHGYTGFVMTSDSGITIEQDLYRRDLTINAIAINCVTKQMVDPYNGFGDIQNRTLKPVSDAFMEDPVRALRVARFMARYGETWSVDPVIHQYTQAMLLSGEFDSVPPSRIINEINLALKASHPKMFFATCEYLNIPHLYNKCISSTNPSLETVTTYKDLDVISKIIGLAEEQSNITGLLIKWCVSVQSGTNIWDSRVLNHKWFIHIPTLLEWIDQLCLFRNASTLSMLIESSIVKWPMYDQMLLGVQRIINNIKANITYSSIIQEHPDLHTETPSLRSLVVNEFRLKCLKTQLADFYYNDARRN